LRRPDVLRDNRDFKRLKSKGKSVGSKNLVLIFYKNDLDFNRYAVLASKKVGNSVKRNRVRRLIKESLRTQKQDIKQGYDILFIARSQAARATFAEVSESMNITLTRSGLYQ